MFSRTPFFLMLAMVVFPAFLKAATLAPELKAYDFAQAYYIEDGGVVIAPYDHGFLCRDGIPTPEGIRLMPGKTFMQFDGGRSLVNVYQLLHLNSEGTRAFFHERTYRYKVIKDERGKYHDVIGELVATNDFYLSQWRSLEWFDFAFPYLEIHPGAQGWRTRPLF